MYCGMVVVVISKIHTMTKTVFTQAIIGFGIIFILLSCSPSQTSSKTVISATETVETSSMESSILYYINEYRHSVRLASLQTLDIATKQAYNHSKNMAIGKTGFGHMGFDKRIDNIKQAVGFITASAENVAYGQLSAKEVVKGWLNSPGHKKNIEGNYQLTGIGWYKDKNGVIYFTQIFLRK
jgi:uncharacterized protein YkwD